MRFIILLLVFGLVLSGCMGISADPIVGCWTQTINFGGITNSLQINADGTYVHNSPLGSFVGTWKNIGVNQYELRTYDEVVQKNIITGEVTPTIVNYDSNQKLLILSNAKLMRTQCK